MSNEICDWCDESILPDDALAPFTKRTHWECGLRAVIGGVNHQNGQCSCCGGTLDPDPAGMTRRESARQAAQLWTETNHAHLH